MFLLKKKVKRRRNGKKNLDCYICISEPWHIVSENKFGGVWFVFLNNHFLFLNNISRISTHFFTHMYFHKYFQTTIFSF